MTQIVPLILDRLKDHLTEEMQTYVPPGDETWAVTVKIGRFQADPTKENVALAISGGAFDDPNYADGRIDNPEFSSLMIRNLPVGEVGGGWYWWRRGTIDIRVYFIKQKFAEEASIDYGYTVHGRLIRAVETCPLTTLEDDFGETTNGTPYVEKTSFFQSGGPKNQYIFRGKLWWRILTHRP
jgi:hypothetical protein